MSAQQLSSHLSTRSLTQPLLPSGDESIYNITLALKGNGMWEKTLLIMSGDNGGPVYWTETPAYPHGGSANNCELQVPRQSSECALLLSEACGQTR